MSSAFFHFLWTFAEDSSQPYSEEFSRNYSGCKVTEGSSNFNESITKPYLMWSHRQQPFPVHFNACAMRQNGVLRAIWRTFEFNSNCHLSLSIMMPQFAIFRSPPRPMKKGNVLLENHKKKNKLCLRSEWRKKFYDLFGIARRRKSVSKFVHKHWRSIDRCAMEAGRPRDVQLRVIKIYAVSKFLLRSSILIGGEP